MSVDIDAQMAALEGEVGYLEGPDNDNKFGPWQGVWSAAWCDSFAQWGAVEHGGFRWPDNCQFGYRGAAYCPFTETDAKGLGLWRYAGDYRRPQRGDQILFDWSGWTGCDHIGTVWGTDDDYATVWTVEGNTGSPQGVHWVRRDWRYIRGFVALSTVLDTRPPTPAGPREMRKGFSGDDVRWLQSRLSDLGYDVPGGIDGDFGDGTEQAVFNFQHDWSPPIDGIVGLVTREDLADDAHRADMQTPVPDAPPWGGVYLRRKARGEAVRVFQARLVERGWTLVADGYFGRVTERVVRAFQAGKGLVVDGLVGPATWDAFWLEPVT